MHLLCALMWKCLRDLHLNAKNVLIVHRLYRVLCDQVHPPHAYQLLLTVALIDIGTVPKDKR